MPFILIEALNNFQPFPHLIYLLVGGGSDETPSSGSGSVAAGVVVALLLTAALIGVTFYYRRRVKNIKTELMHVQYIADPLSRPGM